MKYLNRDDYLSIGESLNYGQQIRVNHSSNGCDGSSKSLLIKRKDNGEITAYCFRCGLSGYYSNSTLKNTKARILSLPDNEEVGNTGSKGRYDSLHNAGRFKVDDWNPHARAWIRQYGITDKEIQDAGIFYVDSPINRVILPVCNNGEISSYQTRKILAEDTAPKYLSYTITDDVHFIPWSAGGTTDTITIVEDYISGIKCARYTDVLVLHSTNLRDIHLKFLIFKKYIRHIIFLDDDNPKVRMAALKNSKLISRFGHAIIVYSNGRDPKDHSDLELKEILT